MAAKNRPVQLSPTKTAALLDRLNNIGKPQAPTAPQPPRQQSRSGWHWEDGADPYLPPAGH